MILNRYSGIFGWDGGGGGGGGEGGVISVTVHHRLAEKVFQIANSAWST